MGVFNTFVGEIRCPQCGEMAVVDYQFKWANQHAIMEDFYVGEQVPGAPVGVYWEEGKGRGWEDYGGFCSHCQHAFGVKIRLVDGVVEGLYTDRSEAPDPPVIPQVTGRDLRYAAECAEALGNCREHIPFIPLMPGQTLVAFGRTWTVQQAFREELVEQDPANRSLAWLAGSIGRNSTDQFVYRVTGDGVTRWARVTDHEPGYGGYHGGNCHFFATEEELNDQMLATDFRRTPISPMQNYLTTTRSRRRTRRGRMMANRARRK